MPLIRKVVTALACSLALAPRAGLPAVEPTLESKVDAQFADWSAATPGCAVGVSRNGEIVLGRAYGMADLEHDVPNRPDTIFEAGSVSKQFTAAAVLLLARDGDGRTTAFSVLRDRVWDLCFERQP